jgi:hypothetical protein
MRISSFIIPSLIGTHDSASYFLNNSKIECGVNPIISDAIHLLEKTGVPINNLIQDWSVAQTKNILKQLSDGAQYLDLRIVKVNNDWYTCHGLLGNTLQTIVNQITTNPIIEITTISEPDEALCNILQGKHVYINKPTCPNTIDSKFIINTFANTPNLQDMIDYNKQLVKYFDKFASHKPYLFKMSWTLTPNVFTMIESLYKHPKTLLELAQEANKEWPLFVDWMIQGNYTWPDIVIFDSI